MAKVHPDAPPPSPPPPSIESLPVNADGKEEIAMTVWRKSLLFNCNGFTVYDSTGNLSFRVDNYSTRRSNSQVLLMDATGIPLFTIKRKRLMSLGLGDSWVIYQGEETKSNPPLFSVARHVTVRRSKWLAHVTPCCTTDRVRLHRYSIEGSYSKRCCTVYDEQRHEAVAEVQRKESAAPGVTWGGDVFRLVVRPGFDGPLAMALVILLDQMFGS